MKNDGKQYNRLSAYSLLNKLEKLKDLDIEAFFELIFKSISKYPDEAVSDPSPKENKIKAMKNIISFFEKKEDFEKCAVLKDILNKIEMND